MQDRQAERRTERQQHGADDHRCGDHAARDDQHDDEDQGQRGDSGDQQVVVAPVLHVLVGRRGAAEVDLGAFQRGALDGFLGGLLDRVDVRDALGVIGSPSWLMMKRTDLPSGEMKFFMPRLKSALSKISGGR